MDDSNRNPELPEPNPPEPNPLEQMLSAFLGPEAAAEAARQMKMQGFPTEALMGALSANDPSGVSLNNLSYLFNNSTSGPINWQMVEDIAKQQAYQAGDPSLSAAQAQQVRQALTVADLWLDPITDFATKNVRRDAWTRVSWVENTLPAWKGICEPVAANASRALSEALQQEIQDSAEYGLPPEMAQLSGSISAAIPRMSSMVFSSQVGQALSALSQESFGSSDSGLPLGDPSTTALILTNVEAFCEGLEIPADEVLQFLAVRECAHARLFSSVPWLTTDLLQAVQLYSQEIALDTEAIAEAARSINPQDPESLQRAATEGIFAIDPTEAQQRSLLRLENMLALIEGWVEVITAQAAAPYLPHADRLQEMLRRRRVTGSPGEQMLGQLVGLHLRPRSARDAARLFRLVQNEQGPAARDDLWAHPDMVPTPEETAHPDQFIEGRKAQSQSSDEIDTALEQLLAGTLGWAEGLGPESGSTDSKGNSESEDDPQDPANP